MCFANTLSRVVVSVTSVSNMLHFKKMKTVIPSVELRTLRLKTADPSTTRCHTSGRETSGIESAFTTFLHGSIKVVDQ